MASKKGSSNNNYYWFLLLPIAALVVAAILLIPRSKGHDWDDDEDDEDNPRTETSRGNGNSAIDRFSDEELRNFPEAPEPEWGGNSPAFRKEVVPGIVISASKNAFEQPTDVRFRFATEAEDRKAGRIVEQQMAYHTPLFTFGLDAGLDATQRIPGTYNVELDLKKLDIPEEMWDGLKVCRIDDYGNLQEWNSHLKGRKFSFDTDRNSLWVITWFAFAAVTAKLGLVGSVGVGLCVVGSALPYGYSYLSLRYGYGNKPFVYDYFEVAHYGVIKMGYCPQDTEHPDPDKYLEMILESQKRVEEHQKEAQRFIDEAQAYERGLRNADNPIPIYRDTYSRFSLANVLAERLNKDDELIELIKDINEEKPQSITDIEKMVQWSVVYLKDVQGLKVPGSMCGIYLGDTDIVDGKSQANGIYHHFLNTDPWLGIWYTPKYVSPDAHPTRVNGRARIIRRIVESEKDKMLLTICHELFHHFQSQYVLNSMFQDLRLAESTASVLERDFADWLYKEGKITYDPRTPEGDTNLEYVDRSPKEWLMGSLLRPITPSFVKLDQLWELGKASMIALMRSAALSNNQQIPLDTTALNASVRATNDAINEMSNRARLSQQQLKDLWGFLGENLGGPNCDAGYMLGDLIDYLRRHRMPSNKLHYILEYGSGGNLAAALKQGFLIDSYEDFYQMYEGFILENLKDIVKRQDYYVQRDSFKTFYREQLLEPVIVDPVNCVQELRNWTHVDAFACRTVKITSRQAGELYNLMLVPSEAMKGDGEKAVKAAILKGDSVFAPTPYYLEADSNGNRSAEHIAMIFTDKMMDLQANRAANASSSPNLHNDDYYDAVAYFAPKETPVVNYTVNGDFRFLFNERPVQALAKKNYVTGVQFMLQNNRTGKQVAIKVKLPEDERVPASAILSLPDRQADEEPDVTGFVRWYYQPDPNDTTSYYSPWSGEGEAADGILIDNDTYIYEAGIYSDLGNQDLTSHAKGHLKVWSDGRFEWSSPSFSRGDYQVSSFSISGKGVLGAELHRLVINVDGALGDIDSTSFTSSGLTVTRQERNDRDEVVYVSTVYRISDVSEAYICFTNPSTPNGPIKVFINFPKATRRSQRDNETSYGLGITGYGRIEHTSTNPFGDF